MTRSTASAKRRWGRCRPRFGKHRFQDCDKALKDEIVAEWSRAPVRDVEGQRLLLQLHKLANKFEGLLTGMVENGKLAQINLDAERDESAVENSSAA